MSRGSTLGVSCRGAQSHLRAITRQLRHGEACTSFGMFAKKPRGRSAWRSALSKTAWFDSVEPEVHLDVHVNGHRVFAVAHGRLELVLANRLHGLFVQPHPQRTNNMHVLRIALSIHNQAHEAYTLVLGAARFVRELGFRLEERYRSRNTAAHLRQSATGIPS